MPETVTRQRRGCDLNPGPSAPESNTLTTRLPSRPQVDAGRGTDSCNLQCVRSVSTGRARSCGRREWTSGWMDGWIDSTTASAIGRSDHPSGGQLSADAQSTCVGSCYAQPASTSRHDQPRRRREARSYAEISGRRGGLGSPLPSRLLPSLPPSPPFSFPFPRPLLPLRIRPPLKYN